MTIDNNRLNSESQQTRLDGGVVKEEGKANQRYMMRGVSAAKEDVHNAIKISTRESFLRHSAKSFLTSSEVTQSIATSCMLMVLAPSPALPTCIGRRRATSPFGRALLRMRSS